MNNNVQLPDVAVVASHWSGEESSALLYSTLTYRHLHAHTHARTHAHAHGHPHTPVDINVDRDNVSLVGTAIFPSVLFWEPNYFATLQRQFIGTNNIFQYSKSFPNT